MVFNLSPKARSAFPNNVSINDQSFFCVENQLESVDPKVVVTLGNFASKLLLDTDVGITRLRGQSYEFSGRHLVPTFHPAAALRGGGDGLACMRADLVRAKRLMGG